MKKTYLIIALIANSVAIAADSAPPAKPALMQPASKLEEIVMVFKTHFDIGYTELASDVIQMYRTSMIDRALDTMQGMPPETQFVWTVSGWPLSQILWDGQDPVRRQRVEEAIRANRISWHAMPCSLETDSLDMETLARSLVFSDNLSKKYGKPLCRAGKMSDVPEHSWFIPTLLANAGVKFLHIGSNNQCVPPDAPDFFWWEGPDGSRVLVFFSKCTYGSALFPPEKWPFKTWFAMQMTEDNQGPPSAEHVKDLVATAKAKLPNVKVTIGTIDDFWKSISKEDLSKLPVVRSDMPDTWIHGIGSMPRETALAHNIRPKLSTWEMLDTWLVQAQLKPDDAKAQFAEAYERSLMFGEHTWGSQTEGIQDDMRGEKLLKALAEYRANGKPKQLVKPGIAFFEESFDQKRRYIWRTRDLVEPGLATDMKLLAENVAVDGSRIVVFNSLPWTRSAIVSVPKASLKDLPPGPLSASAGQAETPVSDAGTNLSFLAKNLPASGYATFVLRKAAPPATAQPGDSSGPLRFENAFFTMIVDPTRGGISSLVDKKTGRELVEQGGDAALGQYLFEQFGGKDVFAFIGDYSTYGRGRGVYRDAAITQEGINQSGQQLGKPFMPVDVNYSANYAANGTVKLDRDAQGELITLTMPPSGKNPDPVTLRIRLYDALPYLDLEWEIANKTPDRTPEGGWLCLPFNLKNPTWKLGRLGAVTDPAKDIVGSANFHLFALETGVSVRDEDGFGVAVCPLDSPLVSLGEPGLWKFSKAWTKRKSRVYVNLFNNKWNTNFPLWIDGSWRSRVRLWTLDARSTDWDMVGPSWEARTACAVGVADGKAGQLPLEQEGVKLSRPGVLVTAFGPNPYGDGTVLRVWEQAGTTGEITVTLPAATKFTTAMPVNLRGEKTGEPLNFTSSKFTFQLKGYAPASFILQ